MTVIFCLAALLAALGVFNVLFGTAASDFDAEIGLETERLEREPVPWPDFLGRLLPLALVALGLPLALHSPWTGAALLAGAATHALLDAVIRRRQGGESDHGRQL